MSRVNKRSGDVDFLSIAEGGTGATTMAAFRANNGILEKNSSKAVILGVGGAFPSNVAFTDDVAGKPILVGSFESIPGQELTFTISNYDSFTNYSVSTADGTVTILNDIIKYTSGSTANGNVTFTVNGAVYTVAVTSLNPTKPVLQVNGVSDGVATTLTVQGSGFTSPAGAVMSTMTVQVATDAGFATIVGNSNAGASVSIGVNSVGIFYVRAKFVDNASRESAWSSVATINSTRLPNSIGTPTMTVKAVKNGSGAKFDVVSSTFVESTGKTHKSTVYQVSDTAAFTTTIYDNTDTVNKLAKSFSVTDTKTTYYVRIKYISSNDGQSAWSDVFSMDRADMPAGIPTNEEAKIVPSPSATSFGVSISITSDGSRVAVGAYSDNSAFIFS